MKFNQKVYKLAKKIPKGKITTYKEIAKKLKTKAYRAVGNALNKNRDKNVPCHRIIKSNGFIGGFKSGTEQKIRMLRAEKVEVKNKRVNLKKYLFKF